MFSIDSLLSLYCSMQNIAKGSKGVAMFKTKSLRFGSDKKPNIAIRMEKTTEKAIMYFMYFSLKYTRGI